MNAINKETLDLIKSFEGLELKAYKDAVGVLTIGYGHTSAAGDPVVKSGMTMTEKEATDLLASDLKKYEAMVVRNVKVSLNDNQYGALLSFVYNLGEGNFKASTLLRKVNLKDFEGAKLEFAKWNKAGGKVLAGLTRRRAAEATLFSKMPLVDTHSPVQTIPVIPAVIQPSKIETPVEAPEGFWGPIMELINALLRRK